ncbi:MAG: Lrp/AsnC ligand binding domain-containing protein [Thermoplasmatales archaeon]|nr:Lrp/AsnC ligand binding domain-containing protein [Thermoplasmatales archaeon]
MRIRRRYLFYLLAILSSIALSVSATFDSIISTNYIKEPWVFCLSFFILGLVTTILILLFLSLPYKDKRIGSFIDPSFRGLRMIRKEELKYHLIAGLGNAGTTISYYFIVSMFVEPSIILSFSQLVILYLLLVEAVAENNAPTFAEVQSALVVTTGAILGSISLHGEINLEALLIVLLFLNPTWVMFSIGQRKLKILRINGKANDSLNIRLWNLIFTTFFVFFAIIFVDRGFIGESFNSIKNSFSFLMVGVISTFFSVVLFIRAMGMGKASVTQAIRASSLFISIPFFLIAGKFFPITIQTDPLLIILKVIGLILVAIGVISFALTDVKAYVFINIRPYYSVAKLSEEILNIKGITAVDVTAGSYDIIAKVRTRTLGKGYERIVRAIENIKGIENFKWQSILKEWEEI